MPPETRVGAPSSASALSGDVLIPGLLIFASMTQVAAAETNWAADRTVSAASRDRSGDPSARRSSRTSQGAAAVRDNVRGGVNGCRLCHRNHWKRKTSGDTALSRGGRRCRDASIRFGSLLKMLCPPAFHCWNSLPTDLITCCLPSNSYCSKLTCRLRSVTSIRIAISVGRQKRFSLVQRPISKSCVF